jgi:hypothetical protein
MSVQIAFPTSVVVSQHHHRHGIAKPKAKSLSAASSAASASATPEDVRGGSLNLQQRRRRASIFNSPQIMLSDPHKSATSSFGVAAGGKSALVGRKEGLKLTFNRSISEPVGQQGLNTPAILSPPSVNPSLHPSAKRCRMETAMPPPPALPLPSPATAMQHAPSLLRPPPMLSISCTVSLPNSPCSESSTLQRTILLQNVRTVDANVLAGKLETSCQQRGGGGRCSPNGNNNGVLIVDCRPFIAYNVNHIRDAINVNCCDRFNRKRLQQGKATLADLATTKEGKETLKRRTWKEVVVYDDCSESLEKLPVSHTLFLVMNALVEDQREPVMLLGGLRDFQVGYRHLCEDHLMNGNRNGRVPEMASHLLPDLPSPSELCHTKDIENHPASQVLPYLFLGNMRDASDPAALRRLGIKFVLNVTAKPPVYAPEPDIVYKQLEAADNGVQNLRQFFEDAFDFIDLAKNASSGVLIHCQAGVSRSPTIAVAYLMKYYPMAMSEAYKFVKTRRSIISPNLNFMGQLFEFEQGLRSETSARPEPLTVEMKEVKESVSKSSFDLDAVCGIKVGSVTGPAGSPMAAFKWSEARGPHEDAANSGCSV